MQSGEPQLDCQNQDPLEIRSRLIDLDTICKRMFYLHPPEVRIWKSHVPSRAKSVEYTRTNMCVHYGSLYGYRPMNIKHPVPFCYCSGCQHISLFTLFIQVSGWQCPYISLVNIYDEYALTSHHVYIFAKTLCTDFFRTLKTEWPTLRHTISSAITSSQNPTARRVLILSASRRDSKCIGLDQYIGDGNPRDIDIALTHIACPHMTRPENLRGANITKVFSIKSTLNTFEPFNSKLPSVRELLIFVTPTNTQRAHQEYWTFAGINPFIPLLDHVIDGRTNNWLLRIWSQKVIRQPIGVLEASY